MTPPPRASSRPPAQAATAAECRSRTTNAAMPRLRPATASPSTREAIRARASALRRSEAIHSPFAPSARVIPAMNTTPSARAGSQPPSWLAVTAKSAAWDSVSKDSAKSAPTSAIAPGCEVRVSRSKSRPRTPTGCTTRSAGVAKTARRFSNPRATSTVTEIHAPRSSSQAGTIQRSVARPTAIATRMTIAPWPSEKSAPHQRASRRSPWLLKRVSPSIATKWSGSRPCFSPRTNTSAASASASCGRPSTPPP